VHEWPALAGQSIYAVECPDIRLHHRPHYSADKYSKDKALLWADLAELTDSFERCLHFYHLGRTELKLKDLHLAFEAFAQAQVEFLNSGADRHKRLYHNLLVPLVQLSIETQEDFSKALVYAQDLTTYFPGFSQGWFYRGYAEFGLGDLDGAQASYAQALASEERLPVPVRAALENNIQLNLGRIALLKGAWEQGVVLLEKVKGQQPSPELDWHLARAYALKGQPSKARKLLAELSEERDLGQALLAQDLWSDLERRQMAQKFGGLSGISLPSLSVCLIVKNEAHCLAACLESVKSIADEIVVVDTGSTDQTLEIAQRFTDKLFHFNWCQDFSAARNYGLQQACKDWILIIDADEVLDSATQKRLKPFLARQNPKEPRVFNFQAQAPEQPPLYTRAVFANHLGIQFKGRVHEWPARNGQLLAGVECPEFVFNHFPAPMTAAKLAGYKALIEMELAGSLNPQERAIYLYHLGQSEAELHNPSAALHAYRQAADVYKTSGSPLQHRFYLQLLNSLIQTALLPICAAESFPEQPLSPIQTVSMASAFGYIQELKALFPAFVQGWFYQGLVAFCDGQMADAAAYLHKTRQGLDHPSIPRSVRILLEARIAKGLAQISHFSQTKHTPAKALAEVQA
jgi:tetratricopeptide (TPR) repeat protein